MSLTDLKKYLKELTKDETEQELINFYKTFKNIKEYYDVKLNKDNEKEILEKYKKKILREFFTISGNYGKANFKIIKEVISSYRKISDNYESIVDLYLYAVENAVEFQAITGEDDYKFINNILNIFEDATNFMCEFETADEKYIKRCTEILNIANKNHTNLEIALSDIYVNNLYEYIFTEDENDITEDKKFDELNKLFDK